MEQNKRILVIGAHADDCESIGGVCLKLVKNGHHVKFLTATNGCSGHQSQMGGTMAVRRYQEAQAVAKKFGFEYDFLDNPDGALVAGLHEREQIIREIRSYAPDIVITHRPCDYHPDHRAASTLVQDAAFLVTVPNVCPLTPVLRYMPAVFYLPDEFQKPYPFEPKLVFDISDVFLDKMRMYHQYTSQMYEWLPWVGQSEDANVPEGAEERFQWLVETRGAQWARFADEWRGELKEKYGPRGETVRYAEALEPCEYGGTLCADELAAIFNF